MGNRYGRSYFNEATGRLARLLGLDGEIPIELGKTITPVVSVGDGTAPGMGLVRGRRWMGRSTNNGAGAGYLTFRAVRDVVVEAVFPWNTAGTGTVYIMAPADVTAAGLTYTNFGIFIERPASSTDWAPVEVSTTFTDPGANKVLLVNPDMQLAVAATPNMPSVWPANVVLQAGAALIVWHSAAAGRVWMRGYEW